MHGLFRIAGFAFITLCACYFPRKLGLIGAAHPIRDATLWGAVFGAAAGFVVGLVGLMFRKSKD